jgi:hypothetical protein
VTRLEKLVDCVVMEDIERQLEFERKYDEYLDQCIQKKETARCK